MLENKKLYEYIRLPSEYWDCSTSQIPDDGSRNNELKVPYKEIVLDWVLNFKQKINGPGLYLFGPYGRGKSGIGAIILKAGAFNGTAGLWLNFPLLQEYSIKPERYMFDNNTSLLERAFETDLLFVDEILIDKNKHWPLGILETLIRVRHQNNQTTILASNKSPKDLLTNNTGLTGGLASIISEATISIEIDGKKFRKV